MSTTQTIARMVKERIIRALTKSTILVFETAVTLAPSKSGFLGLRRAIDWSINKDLLVGRIFVDLKKAPYAPYLEYGVRPHIIKPVHKKALHFKIDGEDVFAKTVHHPGFNERPYMRPALWNNMENIKKIFREELII